MRTDHDQQAVNQVHRVGFEPFAVVFAPIAGGNHGNARVDDLRELRLGLDWFGTAEAIKSLYNQDGTGCDAAFVNGLQKGS